jgi:hypothetical protein
MGAFRLRRSYNSEESEPRMKSGMKLLSFCMLSLAFAMVIFAKTKERPDSDYQDGELVSFRTVAAGSNCSSSGAVKGSVDEVGNLEGKAENSGSCYDIGVRLYTIKVGSHTLVVKHAPENWNRDSVLARQLPGFTFKVRTQKDKLYIKVGERESPFFVVGAQ